MQWEDLTAKRFEAFAKSCGGVCVLPIGVIEKHGNHLPLGTDMITGTSVCRAAAEKEPAVVFPYYYVGQIAEARHYPGTVAFPYRMQMDSLLAVCDEIARNGLKKILIINSHGGNEHFLPYFAQAMPGLDRDYAVYVGSLIGAKQGQYEKIVAAAGTSDLGQHAGVSETALIMHLRGDLVHMEDQDPLDSVALHRLDDVKQSGVFSGFNWYADYPNHFAGDPAKATPELGALIFDILVENIAGCIRAVKEDAVSAGLINEFTARAAKPDASIHTR